ncbi:hypothetical protein AHF37_11701 [Paragonimus kellicotti]|nr:hypothetical protein AHF37_11701 [Paragonimus kellicotti]
MIMLNAEHVPMYAQHNKQTALLDIGTKQFISNWVKMASREESAFRPKNSGRKNRTDIQAKDLHDWANQYRESLSRAIKSSRAHDKDLRVEQNAAATASATLCDADASQPALWERVCHLCSFVTATADDTGSGAIPAKEVCTKDSSKDLHRMRTLLLQLKQNPPTLRRVG